MLFNIKEDYLQTELIKNEKVEVENSIELNDQDILNDILETENNELWLIDMAEGHRSAYWDINKIKGEK